MISEYKHITASVRLITPSDAEKMINANAENQRRVIRNNLKKIEDCIRSGKYVVNGESVIISETGRLLNGQHRLLAVMNTGIPIHSVVVSGVSDSVFPTIDTGKSRELQMVLQMNGYKNAHPLASTLYRLYEYVNGDPIGGGCAVPHAKVMELITDDLCEAVSRYSASDRLRDVLAVSAGAWLYHLACENNTEAAEGFFEKLASGEMLAADSPIYHLRARLISDKASKAKLTKIEKQALYVKAWNAYAENRPLKVLKWVDSEPFPVLVFGPSTKRKR